MSIEADINLILNDFGNTFIKSAHFYASKYINTKARKDTLSDSDLLKSLKVEVKDERLVISVFEYYKWVESGRKVGAKGIPISVIIDWLKKKNIKPNGISINSLAFIIQRSIKLNGISKRPFLTEAYNETIEIFNDKLNDLIDSLVKDILIRFLKNNK